MSERTREDEEEMELTNKLQLFLNRVFKYPKKNRGKTFGLRTQLLTIESVLRLGSSEYQVCYFNVTRSLFRC
jgi:hypothetical protein